MLVHQPTTRISIPEAADKEKAAMISLLFVSFEPKIGLLVFHTQPRLVKWLQAIYNVNGVLSVKADTWFRRTKVHASEHAAFRYLKRR